MRRDGRPLALRFIGKLGLCLVIVLFASPLAAGTKTEYVLDVPLPKRFVTIDEAAHKYGVSGSFEETVGYYRDKFRGKDFVWLKPIVRGGPSGTFVQAIANPYPTSKWAYVLIVRMKSKVSIRILPRAAGK